MHLITGANGQLGSELKLVLGGNGIYADIEQFDITDESQVMQYVDHVSPRCIINCAAYTAVDRAEEDEERAHAINAEGVGYLARAASRANIPLIHVSTDYVFDGRSCLPYVESDPTNPVSAYGRTKLAGERQAMEHAGTAAIVRTSWLYSRFGNNFVQSMLRLGRERDQLNVVFDQVGTPTCAADLAQCLVTIADRIEAGSREIYHYSNEGVSSWYDFAVAIMQAGGLDCIVRPIRSELYPVPAPRPAFSVLDKQKIRAAYDVNIPHWHDSLMRTMSILAD